MCSAAVSVLGATVVAHHSVTGEFDPNKIVTFKGQVTKIEWTNSARAYLRRRRPAEWIDRQLERRAGGGQRAGEERLDEKRVEGR